MEGAGGVARGRDHERRLPVPGSTPAHRLRLQLLEGARLHQRSLLGPPAVEDDEEVLQSQERPQPRAPIHNGTRGPLQQATDGSHSESGKRRSTRGGQRIVSAGRQPAAGRGHAARGRSAGSRLVYRRIGPRRRGSKAVGGDRCLSFLRRFHTLLTRDCFSRAGAMAVHG